MSTPPLLPPLTLVSSPQNAVFRDALSALEGDGSHILVHGLKLVTEVIEATLPTLRPVTLISRESFDLQSSQMGAALFARRFAEKITRIRLSDALFDQVDPFGIPDVIGLFEKPDLTTWSPEEEVLNPKLAQEPTLILATQNPSNLGACLRSAAAFGIKNIVTLKECASPFHPKVIRSSMGATFRLTHFRGPSIQALGQLSDNASRPLIALDLSGEPVSSYRFPKNPLFLIGEEGAGVPANLRGPKIHRVTIPMAQNDGHSAIDSLNAAVSCGIALYAWSTGKS